MQNDLSDFRKIYKKKELLESTIEANPMQQFRSWFSEAVSLGGADEPNAMAVASMGTDGFPKSRMVLLKKYNEEGFVFYTNYDSEKGKSILTNPNVCLSFFWPTLERQVIIKGIAEKTSKIDSDNYFQSRPKGSQLGALVSNQSSVVASRQLLENKLKELEAQFENNEIPTPKNWGGFLVRPQSIEFWQGRPNRLHDRIRYTLLKDFNWKIERLAP